MNDLLSAVANLICGVIQVSAIGSLMFVIFVNYMVTLLNSFGIKVKLFADEIKVHVKS